MVDVDDVVCSAVVPADSDRDGFITLEDFVPVYKTIAAVRRAFKRQDHHNNGQIDRYGRHQQQCPATVLCSDHCLSNLLAAHGPEVVLWQSMHQDLRGSC